MKYIVLIGDGMADYPLKELDEKTPLEAAKIPNMNFIAENGCVGITKTIPSGFTAASDVANLSILGYDPKLYYVGRGPLEAANMGVELKEDDIAFRCNLITVSENKLEDYSAGHIRTDEARQLIEFLNKKLGSEDIRFYPGVSYRHLIVIKDKAIGKNSLANLKCVPPHDIIGRNFLKYLPEGKHKDILIELMARAKSLLARHDVNKVRIDLGENPANMIWLWGQGKKPNMPKFFDKYGLNGSVISAVDLIKGIGKTIGLTPIDVPGATGYYDTNFLGKAEYAIQSLKEDDFVFVHVEAPDEAGHNGDLRQKIAAIENFDKLVVGTVLEEFKKHKNFRILVMPDHATPISVKTHTDDPVLFAVYGKGASAGSIKNFNEKDASASSFRIDKASDLMNLFIHKENIP